MSDNSSAGDNLVDAPPPIAPVEPGGGEPEKPVAEEHGHKGTCLCCGTSLLGPHCHACGQAAHIHRTAGAFLHDLLHGALHFEGKTWRTLPLLAWQPGHLTRRYIAGERSRLVSPMGLFLFCVFLMFAVFQIAGISPPADITTTAQITREVSDEVAALDEQVESLRQSRAALAESDPRLPVLDERIEEIEREIGALRSIPGSPDGELSVGVPFIDAVIEKWKKNPSLMAYKLQSNGYKFSWLLIPLSIPFLVLLFAWRRGFGVYDHAVFVTYSLSFMTLFYVVLVLLGAAGVGSQFLALVGATIPVLHIYRQLKGAYSLSRFSAAWRTVALSGMIFVILFVFIDVLLVLGALG